jgi:hypothetical protein
MSCKATTTHTMVVKLSHEVVVSLMRWLFREATTYFSLLALSPPNHQKSYVALHEMTYGTADIYQCTWSYTGCGTMILGGSDPPFWTIRINKGWGTSKSGERQVDTSNGRSRHKKSNELKETYIPAIYTIHSNSDMEILLTHMPKVA